MKSKIKKTATKLLTAALALGQATSVFANAVNVHEYNHAANPGFVMNEDALSSSLWGSHGKGRLFFGASYDLLNDPIVELNENRTRRKHTLLDSMHSLNLSLAYGIVSRVQLGVSTTTSMVRFEDGHSEFGLGDSRVFSKIRLNSENALVGFALMPELYIPTGNRSLYLSDDSLGGGIKLIAERDFGPLTAVTSAGYRYSPRATFRDLNKKSAIPLSLGLLIPIGSRWAVNTEASGEIAVPFNSYNNPSNFYVGGRYRLPSDFIVHAGAAIGAVNNYSSADVRFIAGITLMPQSRPEPIVEKKPAPAPVIAAAPAPAPAPAPVVVKAEPKARVIFTAKKIEISEEVKFENNKSRLTASGKNLLDEVAKVMKEHDKYFKAVVIEGHTNDIGSLKHNQKLSQQRAASVKEYIASRGVKNNKLRTIGYGETKPKVTLKDGVSREVMLQANRRVEFKVIPSGLKLEQRILVREEVKPATTTTVAVPQNNQTGTTTAPAAATTKQAEN